MVNLLLRIVVSAVAVLIAQWLFRAWDLIRVADLPTALVFAVVLGLLNALVRPVLLLITCPINLLTLGLFTFVVNAAVFGLAAAVVPGIEVHGFVGALAGSLTVAVCSAIASHFLE